MAKCYLKQVCLRPKRYFWACVVFQIESNHLERSPLVRIINCKMFVTFFSVGTNSMQPSDKVFLTKFDARIRVDKLDFGGGGGGGGNFCTFILLRLSQKLFLTNIEVHTGDCNSKCSVWTSLLIPWLLVCKSP